MQDLKAEVYISDLEEEGKNGMWENTMWIYDRSSKQSLWKYPQHMSLASKYLKSGFLAGFGIEQDEVYFSVARVDNNTDSRWCNIKLSNLGSPSFVGLICRGSAQHWVISTLNLWLNCGKFLAAEARESQIELIYCELLTCRVCGTSNLKSATNAIGLHRRQGDRSCHKIRP